MSVGGAAVGLSLCCCGETGFGNGGSDAGIESPWRRWAGGGSEGRVFCEGAAASIKVTSGENRTLFVVVSWDWIEMD